MIVWILILTRKENSEDFIGVLIYTKQQRIYIYWKKYGFPLHHIVQ